MLGIISFLFSSTQDRWLHCLDSAGRFRCPLSTKIRKSPNPPRCCHPNLNPLSQSLALALEFCLNSLLLLVLSMSEGHGLALTQAQLVSSLLGYCGLGQSAFHSNSSPTLHSARLIRTHFLLTTTGVAIACFIPLIRKFARSLLDFSLFRT